MKVSSFPALATVLIAIATAGCGSGSSGGGSNPSFGPIAGTWRATDVTGGGPDTPCPTVFAATNAGGTLSRFGCGSNDTLIFNTDGTFTGSKAAVENATTMAETFSGHWSQFQLRVMLTVDRENGAATFPYSTNIDFRNENQFTIPAAGFPSINRFVFTRQQ